MTQAAVTFNPDGSWSCENLSLDEIPIRLASIEAPGRVENPARLIKALGGATAIAECLANPSVRPLVLRIRPEDRFSKFLPAQMFKSCGIVLKLRRKKDASEAHIEALGMIRQVYRFTSIADYYQSPDDTFRQHHDEINDMEKLRQLVLALRNSKPNTSTEPSAADSPPKVEEEDLSSCLGFTSDVMPALFTRQIFPFDYRYEANAFLMHARHYPLPKKDPNAPDHLAFDPKEEFEDEETSRLLVSKKGEHAAVNLTAHIADLEFPNAAVQVPRLQTRCPTNDDSLLLEVRALFEQRPLWLRPNLMASMSKSPTLWKIKSVLAQSCFIFCDGPFRACLCRFGYDPRLDPESRKYQSIDFRDGYFRSVKYKTLTGDRKRRDDNIIDETDFVDFQFRSAPQKHSCIYQLADIEDVGIQQILQMTNAEPQFSPVTGWFNSNTMQRIRDLLVNRADTLRFGGQDAKL